MSKKIFQGVVFLLAGSQWQPEHIVRNLISQYGGTIELSVSDRVSYLLSSDEMASVYGNPYKLQFFPDFENQVEMANVYHIPIVNGSFLQACIDAGKIVEVGPFLIFGGLAKQVDTQSNLDPRVQEIVKLIFDKTAQQQAIVDMNLDSSRVMTITAANIQAAYSLLSETEKYIQMKSVKKTQDEATQKLSSLSQKFYSLIPHTKTPTIDSTAVMKEKLSMLEALTDIEIANRLMQDSGKVGRYSVNPMDINYKKLKTRITPLNRFTQEYDIICNCVKNTHAEIHSYFNVELDDIFEVDREGEGERFEPCSKLKHHRLLWHGSRLSNYVGILSQGLRIAPPEAPVTGYFLGKGVYFADMMSKSIEYCHPTPENPNVLMMLCQVALGRPFQVAHTKFVSKEDLDLAAYHSVKGCGELGPDPAYDVITPNGVIVSIGKEANTGVSRSELKHNEYIVYSVAQIKIQYLVKLRVTSDKQVKAA